MKNIINSETLNQFKDRIELGVGLLQEQQIPVNAYTFGFIVQELNKYILEDEHPRYVAFVDGKLETSSMELNVFIADRFNQNDWVDLLTFTYPKDAVIEKPVTHTKSFKDIVPTDNSKPTIVPVPVIENFDSTVQSRKSTPGVARESRRGVGFSRHHKFKYTTYTEYVNFVSVLFDEFAGCTECLNKSLITAFLGNFSYPEAFVSSGKTVRQHLQLKSDVELNDDVKKKFQIDWSYFLDNWSDNAITLAHYKTADATRTYNNMHKSIDLIEQRVGAKLFALTDFGKVIWEHVHEALGYMEPEESIKEEVIIEEPKAEEGISILPTAINLVNRVGTEERLEEHVEQTVEGATVKVRHMGYAKCKDCAYFNRHKQWCDKREGYINNLEHDECFEEEKPNLEVAPKEEVERICFNCKRWHSGNNPGNLKAIACRCPVVGRKTLTDNTCAKFVAIVRKED